MSEADLSVFLRVLVVTGLAGLLGWERESAGKAAGLRTHILVGVASVLFVVIGEYMSHTFSDYGPHVRFDVANLLGAIVTGVSFLGAGMIFFKKDSHDVHGLTTAAGILLTAAIGILVGLNKFVLAIGSTLIVFIVLSFAKFFEVRFLTPKTKEDPKTEDTIS